MCSATDSYDIALASEGIDICHHMFDGDPIENDINNKLDFNKTLAFKNFELVQNPNKYEFSSIDSYETFASRVPSFTYEEYFPIINKTINGNQNIFWPEKIKWFAQSSGTTNSKSKFIPVSNKSLDDCHFKGGKDMLCLYLNNNENSNIFLGKSLMW